MLTQASNTLILALLVSMTDLESLFSASDSDTNISDFFDIKKRRILLSQGELVLILTPTPASVVSVVGGEAVFCAHFSTAEGHQLFFISM
jgi:hypothetical protein